MNKLLTDRELRQAIDEQLNILGSSDDVSGVALNLVNLVRVQKQAHADMVIGESLSYHSMNFDVINSYDDAFEQGSIKTISAQRERRRNNGTRICKRDAGVC